MNSSRPDLNLLVIFEAVLRNGSVTGASRDLALSQPAVSHALNRLRDVLKDPLFLRSKQGLVPTARAQQLVAPVQRILSDANLVFAALDFVAETSARVYNIAASDYSALTFIPNLVRHLRLAAPGVILNVFPFAESTLRDLASGDVDISFWGTVAPRNPWRWEKLFTERYVGVIAKSHVLAAKVARSGLSLDDYLAHPHVVVSLRDPGANQIDETLAGLNRNRKIAARTSGFVTNLACLQNSDLIASGPQRLCDAKTLADCMIFEIPLALKAFDYGLVWHARADVDPGLLWLRKQIALMATTRP
jgi:DNA-binding transcriptional LysR family regulator